MIISCRKKVQFLSQGLPENVSALFKISDVFLLSAFTAVTEELHCVFHVEKGVFCHKKTTFYLIIRCVKVRCWCLQKTFAINRQSCRGEDLRVCLRPILQFPSSTGRYLLRFFMRKEIFLLLINAVLYSTKPMPGQRRADPPVRKDSRRRLSKQPGALTETWMQLKTAP